MTLASSLNWTQLTFCGKRVKRIKKKHDKKRPSRVWKSEKSDALEMEKRKSSPQRGLWICVRRCLSQRPTGSPSCQSCRNKSGCCRRSCWSKRGSLLCRITSPLLFFRHLRIMQTFTAHVAMQSPVGIQNLVPMTSVRLQQRALFHTPQLQRFVTATSQQIVPIDWWCRETRVWRNHLYYWY